MRALTRTQYIIIDGLVKSTGPRSLVGPESCSSVIAECVSFPGNDALIQPNNIDRTTVCDFCLLSSFPSDGQLIPARTFHSFFSPIFSTNSPCRIHSRFPSTIISERPDIQMPRSKGRASRSDSGTWRRGSPEDSRDERSVSEEEVMVKPRAASVARSTRGRRSKAETSSVDTLFGETQRPTAGRRVAINPSSTRIPGVRMLSIAGSVIALPCLYSLLAYSAASMKDQASRPPPLSGEESSAALDDLVLWIHNTMPWMRQLPEAETGIESLKTIHRLEDAGLELKNADFVCHECPACINTVVCTTEPLHGTEQTRDPVPLPLPPFLSKHPAISQYTRQIFASCYEAVQDHPWVFMLLMLCAAWKAMELLLRAGKVGGAYALDAAAGIMRMYQGDEIMVKLDLDDESERARKEAEEKLLLRMSTVEPVD